MKQQLSSSTITKATAKLHLQIHKNVFILMKQKSTSILPYFLANTQLYIIYQALEDQFKTFPADTFSQLRQPQLDSLFDRAEARWDDLQYMQKKYKGLASKNLPMEKATQEFIIQIDKASPHQWLGFFLVRILGDLNGGAFVRINLTKIYHPYFLISGVLKALQGISIGLEKTDHTVLPNMIHSTHNCCLNQKGTRAYQFDNDVKKTLESVLPNLCQSDQQVNETLNASKTAFRLLNTLYDELHTRMGASEKVEHTQSAKVKYV